MFEVLYANSYGGGLEFSNRFHELYSKMTGKDNQYISRYDPVAIQIFKEKGSDWCANNQDSKYKHTICIKEMEDKYRKYVYIQEYDGLEKICIDYAKIYEDILKEYLNSDTMSKTELLNKYNYFKK